MIDTDARLSDRTSAAQMGTDRARVLASMTSANDDLESSDDEDGERFPSVMADVQPEDVDQLEAGSWWASRAAFAYSGIYPPRF